MWIRAVLDTLDQCLSLPGEIACIVTAYLQNSCLDYGCYALNQLERFYVPNAWRTFTAKLLADIT